MFRFLILKSWHSPIFLASFLSGMFFYTMAAPRPLQFEKETTTEKKGLKLSQTRLDAEFKVFSLAKRPVDIGFDEEGNFFVLSRNGRVIRGNQESSDAGQLYFEVNDPSFLQSAGCSAIAVHPDFLIPQTAGFGKFYLAFAEQPRAGRALEPFDSERYQEVVYEYTSRDPRAARFAGDRREVLRLSHPGMRRTGLIMDLAFDGEGFLYVAVADLDETGEGSKASQMNSLYGKVLRIDPLLGDHAGGYGIPEDNPFRLAGEVRPEIWAYGFRNPHNITCDPLTGWISVCDSGPDSLQEINISRAGAEFFGWNLFEGSNHGSPDGHWSKDEGIVRPFIEFARGETLGSVVGSCVYRGENFPFLEGKMIFADHQGRLVAVSMSLDSPSTEVEELQIIGEKRFPIARLVQGSSGELFVFGTDGKIFELKRPRRVSEKDPEEREYRGIMLVSVD